MLRRGLISDLELAWNAYFQEIPVSFEGNWVNQLAHHLNYVSNMNFSAHTGPHP